LLNRKHAAGGTGVQGARRLRIDRERVDGNVVGQTVVDRLPALATVRALKHTYAASDDVHPGVERARHDRIDRERQDERVAQTGVDRLPAASAVRALVPPASHAPASAIERGGHGGIDGERVDGSYNDAAPVGG